MFQDRRMLDRGRRIEDCSRMLGIALMMIYGACIGCIIGFIVGRASL